MNISSSSSNVFFGLQAAQTRLEVATHAVANSGMNTHAEDFRPLQVEQNSQSGGSISSQLVRSHQPSAGLEGDVIAQLQAKNAFLVNLNLFRTNHAMLGTLLNART